MIISDSKQFSRIYEAAVLSQKTTPGLPGRSSISRKLLAPNLTSPRKSKAQGKILRFIVQDLYASSRLKYKPACFFMWEVIVRKAIGVANYLAREAVIAFFTFSSIILFLFCRHLSWTQWLDFPHFIQSLCAHKTMHTTRCFQQEAISSMLLGRVLLLGTLIPAPSSQLSPELLCWA
jgi:hypothetical protein